MLTTVDAGKVEYAVVVAWGSVETMVLVSGGSVLVTRSVKVWGGIVL